MNNYAAVIIMGLASWSCAETVVDVSQQWKAHESTATAAGRTASGEIAIPAVAISTETNSCICDTLTTPEKLEAATYAFTGTVFEVGKPKEHRRTVVLDVDEIFKGSPKQEMDVTEELTGTDCDLSFAVGQNYLVYAQWNWGTVMTSRCMGTKVLEPASVQALGPSQSIKEKLYDHLRNACMGRTDTPCCLASLKAMRANYNVPEPEQGCPDGMIPDRLSCQGSYTWCISPREKSHRKAP